jgi:hypothetical protein
MLLWEDVERRIGAALRQSENAEVIECPVCHSTFLTLEEYKQYRRDRPVGLGQVPPPHPRTHKFYFYRCICGEVIEPPMSMNQNAVTQLYNKFIETVKKVLDAPSEE